MLQPIDLAAPLTRPTPAPGTAEMDALRARKAATPWMHVSGMVTVPAWHPAAGDIGPVPGWMTIGSSYN